jgi:hypothetical protein
MTRSQILKKIRNFVAEDSNSNFKQKITLIRMVDDIRQGRDRHKDNLNTILLRIRYGVRQRVPYGWTSHIGVPSEEMMAGELVGKPVPKGYVIRGGSYERPNARQKTVERWEKKSIDPIGGRQIVIL